MVDVTREIMAVGCLGMFAFPSIRCGRRWKHVVVEIGGLLRFFCEAFRRLVLFAQEYAVFAWPCSFVVDVLTPVLLNPNR